MNNVIQYTIKQVCDILGVEIPKEYISIEDEKLSNITMNVNSLKVGGAFLLAGANKEDRENQLKKALLKKPKIVFAGKAGMRVAQIKEVPHIQVKDTYDAMVLISSAMRKSLSAKVVGITGSLGKTSTKELIYTVLNQEFSCWKNHGNRNNTKGIFLTVQEIPQDVQFHVQEYGVAIGKRSMESKVQACVPDATVITNISDPHIEILGSRENIMKEKLKLVTETEAGCPVFLNYDDELLKNVVFEEHPVISYAVENKNADYYAEDIQVFEDKLQFVIVHGERRTPVTLYTVGIHNVGNAVAAMAVGEWAGVPMEKIVEGIAAYRSEGVRQTLSDVGGYRLYIDCYNAAPVSMIGAVKTLAQLPVEPSGKRVAVVGEMKELGSQSKELHMQVGEEIGKSNIDLVICFGGDDAKLMADVIKKYEKAVIYTDKRHVLNYYVEHLITRKDIALFKGSHALMLHKTIDQVYGTSHHYIDDYVIDKAPEYSYIIANGGIETKKSAALKQYTGKSSAVVINNSYKESPVEYIFDGCFKNNEKIKKVDIQAAINGIGESAFEGCKRLKSIVLPPTVKRIEKRAFYQCQSLTEIVIPAGVTEIGEEAFAECTSLKKVITAVPLERFRKNAFAGCPKVVFQNLECE